MYFYAVMFDQNGNVDHNAILHADQLEEAVNTYGKVLLEGTCDTAYAESLSRMERGLPENIS